MIRLNNDCLLRISQGVAVRVEHLRKAPIPVGSAVSLAQAGALAVDMQTAVRRRDQKMAAHYARAEPAEREAIARFRYGKLSFLDGRFN